MKKNFKEKLISSWKTFLEDPIFYILFRTLVVTIIIGLIFILGMVFFRFDRLIEDQHFYAYLEVLFGSIFLLYAYMHLKGFYQRLKDPKPKTRFELYQGEDEAGSQAICLFYIFGYPLLIYGEKSGLGEKLGGYFWILLLGWFIVSFIIVAFVRWIGALISRRVEAKRESAAEPIKAAENRPSQHLEKSPYKKDQDDQVMITKGKKEKSLYQRLQEMPYSNDRVGQSIIIVRGRHVIKPKSKSPKPGENNDS